MGGVTRLLSLEEGVHVHFTDHPPTHLSSPDTPAQADGDRGAKPEGRFGRKDAESSFACKCRSGGGSGDCPCRRPGDELAPNPAIVGPRSDSSVADHPAPRSLVTPPVPHRPTPRGLTSGLPWYTSDTTHPSPARPADKSCSFKSSADRAAAILLLSPSRARLRPRPPAVRLAARATPGERVGLRAALRWVARRRRLP